MAEQNRNIYKTMKTIKIFWKLLYEASFFIQNVVRRYDLRATNGTFITKGECESNFLGTPTEEPKLNHWVKNSNFQIHPFS